MSAQNLTATQQVAVRVLVATLVALSALIGAVAASRVSHGTPAHADAPQSVSTVVPVTVTPGSFSGSVGRR